MQVISRPLVHLRWRRPAERLTPPLLRERWVWVAISLFWAVLGTGSWLIEYGLSFEAPGGPMTLGRAAARLVYAALWWGVTVFAVWISDALTVRSPRQFFRVAFHLATAAVVATTWAVTAYHINREIIPGWLPLGVERMVNTTFLTSYFYYIGFLVVAHGLIFMRESRAREVSALQRARLATEAQLRLLKMELQPHFLFNTLNAISALMHRDVRAANEMLVLLADLLDAALENVRDQEVTLREEFEILRLYTQIQQIRFEDRLQVVYDIDPESLTARVPHLMLQPLVENSIKHGIANRARGGRIEISARLMAGQLVLSVQDDGRGLRDERPVHGIGLTNTRERLAHLYGDRQQFEICDAPGGGVRVTVSIPLQDDQSAELSA